MEARTISPLAARNAIAPTHNLWPTKACVLWANLIGVLLSGSRSPARPNISWFGWDRYQHGRASGTASVYPFLAAGKRAGIAKQYHLVAGSDQKARRGRPLRGAFRSAS
jgi:hypothetical protein